MSEAPIRVLILGAAYGMLPGIKLSLAGHSVTLVGRADEIATMAKEGLSLTVPVRKARAGQEAQCVLRVKVADAAGPGTVALRTPFHVDPEAYDFVVLAMQEPQFAAPDVAALVGRIAAAGLPCLSVMNLPPLPFLASLGTIPKSAFDGVYASEAVWRKFPGELLSVACPDAQALRLDPARPGQLHVTLPSNFKAAPFIETHAQTMLNRLAQDMSRLKLDSIRPPVLLLVRSSRHAPLAKWPMLIAGNYRCAGKEGPRSIEQAVYDDLEQSRLIYDEVVSLIRALGTPESEVVPFNAYVNAARSLTRPSSVARALAAGAIQVERVDRLVANLLQIARAPSSAVEAIVDEIDAQLASNRA